MRQGWRGEVLDQEERGRSRSGVEFKLKKREKLEDVAIENIR